jgi:serine/threonine protein kinase
VDHDREAFVKSVFLEAIALESPEARGAYLKDRCAGDLPLYQRVIALVVAHDRAVAQDVELQSLPADDERTSAHPATPPFTGQDGGQAAGVGIVIGGRYKLIEQIGEGGMGNVFMALQTEPVKRTVAVKVIRTGLDSRAVLARFEAERQALAMMDHPNIARVLDAGTTEAGRPYFVMELVKGMPITKFCDERRLNPRQRLELFIPVCEAIQHAHQKGIIHRDVKPSNVLVAFYDDRPVPKVIDFGIAKAAGQTLTDMTLVTGFGAVVGTPEYMSPEQANLNNLDVDTRSDVYSLGVLLYELLTGCTPVDRKCLGKATVLEILRIVREEDAPKPSHKLSRSETLPNVAANRGIEPAKLAKLLKGELDWLVLKALEKDRTRRYESAIGFAQDIRRYLADEIVEARPPSSGYRLRKFVRRRKAPVIAALLVLAALLTGVVGTSVGLFRAEQAARREAAAKAQMHRAMTRQMADRLQSDMLRLAAIGNALAATVKQGHTWNERQFIDWMNQTLETEPEILGLCIAFEPGTFNPPQDPVTIRQHLEPVLPMNPDAMDPYRDGYNLYVSHQHGRPGSLPVAQALKKEYRYRAQQWYRNTRERKVHGWEEEPTPDRYGSMVAYTLPLYQPNYKDPIGALCLDLSVAYFDRLDAWLRHPNLGVGSYGFVLSPQGKVISHPYVQRLETDPFPSLLNNLKDVAFSGPVERMLDHTDDDVGELTAIDPKTGRRSRFLFTRFQPANWLFIAVIPDNE